MKSILIGAGIDVENLVDFCITGKEALNQVKGAFDVGIKYRIIFTDFSMPVMDGL